MRPPADAELDLVASLTSWSLYRAVTDWQARTDGCPPDQLAAHRAGAAASVRALGQR